MSYLHTGKIQSDFLAKLLGIIEIDDERVVVGPGVGEDAAVLDMGDRYLVVKSDPITFATERIGWYAVNINANDIAAMGGVPRWFLVTILLPEKKTTPSLIESIMEDLRRSCEDLGISLIGGHTEVTHGLKNPILSGTMLGEAGRGDLVRNGDVREGDLLYLTRGIAIEGTALIARERPADVIEAFGEDFHARCVAFLHDPGISVLRDAGVLRTLPGVRGMHDPTEGGVLAGAWEMAAGSGIALRLFPERIPVYEETRSLCARFGLSPHGLIASGALLVAVERARKADFERGLASREGEISDVNLVGEFTSGEGVLVSEGGVDRRVDGVERDEITKIFPEDE
jgi:hydrogenase maturation factor